MIFLKIFNIVRNSKKYVGGHHEEKLELKQLLFLGVYLSGREILKETW